MGKRRGRFGVPLGSLSQERFSPTGLCVCVRACVRVRVRARVCVCAQELRITKRKREKQGRGVAVSRHWAVCHPAFPPSPSSPCTQQPGAGCLCVPYIRFFFFAFRHQSHLSPPSPFLPFRDAPVTCLQGVLCYWVNVPKTRVMLHGGGGGGGSAASSRCREGTGPLRALFALLCLRSGARQTTSLPDEWSHCSPLASAAVALCACVCESEGVRKKERKRDRQRERERERV